MLASLFSRYLCIFAVVCVLALFFFPLAHGPFQATHGPTTALRARRAFLLIVAILMAALNHLLTLVRRAWLASLPIWHSAGNPVQALCVEHPDILRC